MLGFSRESSVDQDISSEAHLTAVLPVSYDTLTFCVTSHYIFQCAKLKYDSITFCQLHLVIGSFSIFPLFPFLVFMLVSIIFGQNLHSLSHCGDFHISTDKPALDIDKGLPLCKGKKTKSQAELSHNFKLKDLT